MANFPLVLLERVELGLPRSGDSPAGNSAKRLFWSRPDVTLRVERVCETGRSAVQHAKGTELLQNGLIYQTNNIRRSRFPTGNGFRGLWLKAADEVDCLVGN
jgi:hypothetical protein